MPSAFTTCIVVNDTAHLQTLKDNGYLAQMRLVFAPDQADGVDVLYEGDLALPTTEVLLAKNFGIQAMPLCLADYIPAVGPRLLRIMTEADINLLSDAAAEATRNGSFRPVLTSPDTILANETAFGLWNGSGTPRQRLWIAADGTVRISMDSKPLGTIHDAYDNICSAFDSQQTDSIGCSLAINTVLTDEKRRALLDPNPSITKFLAAAILWRTLNARGIEPLRVSGFGGGLSPFERVRFNSLNYCILWSADAVYLGTSPIAPIVKIPLQIGHILEEAEAGDCTALDNASAPVRKQIQMLRQQLGTSTVADVPRKDDEASI